MAAMSSAQIVSASAIHSKAVAQGLTGIPGSMAPHAYPAYGSQVRDVSPFIHFFIFYCHSAILISHTGYSRLRKQYRYFVFPLNKLCVERGDIFHLINLFVINICVEDRFCSCLVISQIKISSLCGGKHCPLLTAMYATKLYVIYLV